MTNELNGTDIARENESAKAVEAGLAMHLRIKAALDDARGVIARQESQLTQAAVELEALRSFNTMLESRIESAIAERDLAVGQRAKYEALFSMMLATMREFNVPAVPLIREMESKNVAENAARQRRA
jgi:hypothetical protein